MINYETLSEDFFKLKTKVAGNIIQNFINYSIKAATIVPYETIQKGRFKEMAMEMNKRYTHFPSLNILHNSFGLLPVSRFEYFEKR